MLYTQSKWSSLTAGEKAVNVVTMATTVGVTVMSVIAARKTRGLEKAYQTRGKTIETLEESLALACQRRVSDVSWLTERHDKDVASLEQDLANARQDARRFESEALALREQLKETESQVETRRLPGETYTMWADRLVAEGLADTDKSTQWLVAEFGTKAKVETEEDYW